MTPFLRGGLRPPEFLALYLLLVVPLALASSVSAQDAVFEASAEMVTSSRFALGLSLGQVESSALPAGGAQMWTLEGKVQPFDSKFGLSVEFQVESLDANQPGEGWDLKLDSRGVEYGFSLGFAPDILPVGFEYHRLDGNSLPSYASTAQSAGGEYVIDGAASHLYSLGHRGRHHRARIGYGQTGLQANSAPYLLGLHGYLPSPRRANGPFATLTAERLRVFGFVGRAGAMFMLDQHGDRPYSGDFLAWGATLHRALGERMILGASYMAASSSVRSDGLPSMFSLYLRLRWSHSPTHQS